MDTIQGGAGDDTITALQATTATFTIGDNIIGGAGTDTLNILNTTATASAVVSIDGVENINVRMLQAATQAFDATDWSGVEVISNASSIADSTLSVSGLTISTDISVNDESNVRIEFSDIASGADTANVILNSVGSGTTSTVTVIAGGTADVNLDATGADTLAAVNVAVVGENYLRLEGGDGLRTVTLTGAGNLHLTTDDLITSLNASALTGTNRFTLSGRSDVSVVGGAGKDTFAFGTSLNSYDTIDGGAGATDALTATLGNTTVRLNAKDLEQATFTLSETVGGVDFSGAASVTSLTVAATAGAVGTFTNFAGGTANLSDGDADVVIDTVANGTLVVNVGSGSGSIGFSAITVTDATTLVVNATGSGQVTQTVDALVATAAKTVTLNGAGSASLVVTEGAFSAATVVNLNAAGSGALTLADGIGGSALATINIKATDSNAADVSVGSASLFENGSAGSLARAVNIDATSGADVTLFGVHAGSASYSASGTIATGTLNPVVVLAANAGNASIIDFGDILATGVSATLNLNAGVSGSVVVDDLISDNQTATGAVSININAVIAQDGNVDIDLISGSGMPVNVAAVTIGSSGNFTLGSAGIYASGGKVTIGTVDVSTNASFTGGAVIAQSAAAVTINVGVDGDAVVGNQLYAGGNNSTTTLTVASSGSATFGTIQASSIGAISVTLADNSTGAMGNLGATGGGKIGDVSATIGASSLFAFGDIGSAGSAIASVGNITLTLTGSKGSGDVGNVIATAASVGEIRLSVTGGADVDMGTVYASSVGAITVAGSGDVTIGKVTTTYLGGLDLRNQGSGASFTIDLSGVTNGVQIDGGRGTNTIISGLGNDEFFLKTGLGTDTISFTSAVQKVDSIYNFQVGTSTDKIALAGASGGYGGGLLMGSSIATGDAGINLITESAAGAITLAAGTASGATVVLMQYTAFTDLTALATVLISGGAAAITGVAGGSASGDICVVWTDGSDSYVTLFNVDKAGSGLGDAVGSAIASAHTLATLVNVDVRVTAAALIAGNFDITG